MVWYFQDPRGRVAFLVRRIFVQRGALLRRNQFVPFHWRLDRGDGRVGAETEHHDLLRAHG
jgi:hypothetical protein